VHYSSKLRAKFKYSSRNSQGAYLAVFVSLALAKVDEASRVVDGRVVTDLAALDASTLLELDGVCEGTASQPEEGDKKGARDDFGGWISCVEEVEMRYKC
jgi:hypothetical protein